MSEESHTGMTWLDVVAQEVPELPEELRETILWEYTAYPFNTVGDTRQQLREFRERWLSNGRQFWDALAEDMEALRAKEAAEA